jgi:hypothetical protein
MSLIAAVTENTGKLVAKTVTKSTASLGSAAPSSAISVPTAQAGTNYVPRDMLMYLHKGESVIPAAYSPPGGPSALSVHNHFILGDRPMDTRTQSQIALATQRSVELVNRRNR